MRNKKEIDTEVNETTNSTNPNIEIISQPLGLNLDLGRQDLSDNFRKIEEAINELRKK